MRKTTFSRIVLSCLAAVPLLAQAAPSYQFRFPMQGVSAAGAAPETPAENENSGGLFIATPSLNFGSSLAPLSLTVRNGGSQEAFVDYSTEGIFDILDSSSCESHGGVWNWDVDPPVRTPGTGLAPGATCEYLVFPEDASQAEAGAVVTGMFELENKASGSTQVVDTVQLTATVPVVRAYQLAEYPPAYQDFGEYERHPFNPMSGYTTFGFNNTFGLNSRANVPLPVTVSATGLLGVRVVDEQGNETLIRNGSASLTLSGHQTYGMLEAGYYYDTAWYGAGLAAPQTYSGTVTLTVDGQSQTYTYDIRLMDCYGGC